MRGRRTCLRGSVDETPRVSLPGFVSAGVRGSNNDAFRTDRCTFREPANLICERVVLREADRFGARSAAWRLSRRAMVQMSASSKALRTALNESEANKEHIIAEDVWFSWRNVRTGKPETPVLRGVSLNVRPGEFVMLVGGNGSGKSTLLKTLREIYVPDAGRISVPHRTALVFQNAGATLMLPSVAADLMLGMPESVETKDMPDKVAANLEAVGLRGYENRRCASLSGGERQRIALASALAMEPDAMMFDEMTASMDQQTREYIVRMIRERVVEGRKAPVLWVTHLLEEINYADRVVVLDKGVITHDGPPTKMKSVLVSLRKNRAFWS
eukprot:CAMPEP_0185843966 /NCGR_PEP_ID=MMETSP1354-20130828/310_1 /TAXON_ID=708628 /ORGANISM="Erythrolobus madagascarensis, Strain CCMP3276" /LENGTH=328 /DNA_ID=CAMNT_0028543565 /DNA_START=53 /DNA_END=1039 /DNA_ORIENTATION=+